MSNEDLDAPVASAPSRRSPRQGVGGSPMGSTISIVLAVVAVIVGFLILNNITDDGPSGDTAAPVDTVADTTPDSVVETTPPTTTEPPLVTEGATAVAPHASGVPGSAGRRTTGLATAGFTMAAATLYGSAFDAGRRSSRRPFQPSSTVPIGMRIEAPRSETPKLN